MKELELQECRPCSGGVIFLATGKHQSRGHLCPLCGGIGRERVVQILKNDYSYMTVLTSNGRIFEQYKTDQAEKHWREVK